VPAALLLARLVLAVVLGAAGVAKLRDRGATAEALAAFGAPGRSLTTLALVLPIAELLIAGALLPRRAAWWGALAALALLAAFTAAVARALARGQRPDCRCFGQLGSSPIGAWTLVRNGALLALAALVAVGGRGDPGPSAVAWLLGLPPPHRALAMIGLLGAALLALVALQMVRLSRLQAEILARLGGIEDQLESGGGRPAEREEAAPPDKGLPVGAPAPEFELPDLDGRPRSLGLLLAVGRPVLLLFTGPACDPCLALVPDIRRWAREHAATLTLALVSSGDPAANRAKFDGVAADRVLLQRGSEVADAYSARWTPGAVVVGRRRRLASAIAYGDAAIRTLVAEAAAGTGAAANGGSPRRLGLLRRGPPGLGDPAPPLARPSLDGTPVDLGDYRGRETLVVFWQPRCPHCQRLAEDLRRWEAEPPRDAPRLLVVSSGSVEDNRALGFQSTIVLDEGFAIGKAFGARGTPSAVLVDAEGRIASTVAVGARDVLALAGVVPVVPRFTREGPT
jgi:peroxiredoxin